MGSLTHISYETYQEEYLEELREQQLSQNATKVCLKRFQDSNCDPFKLTLACQPSLDCLMNSGQ